MIFEIKRNDKKQIEGIERVYTTNDLKEGKCTSCGEQSNEILIGDGRCLDCVEEQNFYEETMRGL